MKKKPWGNMNAQPGVQHVGFVKLANGTTVSVSEVTREQWRASGLDHDEKTGALTPVCSGWFDKGAGLAGPEYVAAEEAMADALEPVLIGRQIDIAVMGLLRQALFQVEQISDEKVRQNAWFAIWKEIQKTELGKFSGSVQ